MEMEKNRIEFIDLAKGLCILLVVSWHVDTNDLIYFDDIEFFFKSFRMPLYFILSGIFISFRGGIFNFFEKKINKIIVPFIFFVTITNVVFWIVKDILGGYQRGWFADEFQWMSPIIFCYEGFPKTFNNQPIWFLPCLFNTYIFYMIVDKLSRNKPITKIFLTICFSLIGYSLFVNNVKLPFYIVHSMNAVPYMLIGEFLRKKSKLLVPNKKDKYNLVISIGFFSLLALLIKILGSNPFWGVSYVYGFLGTIGVLLIAKHFNSLPIVSYIGRYSLIMLGVHGPMIGFFKSLFSKITPNIYVSDGLVFFAIILSSIIVIKVLVKYLPWFVAQKKLVYFSR